MQPNAQSVRHFPPSLEPDFERRVDALCVAIVRDGYVFARARWWRELARDAASWHGFRDSWSRLELDRYMADGGVYRHRRHATFSLHAPTRSLRLEAHQPHYQDLAYNPLNGGVARHFAPIELATIEAAVFVLCMRLFGEVVMRLDAAVAAWHIEVHQFRIEARAEAPTPPTPEGVHRDGVQYAFMLMIGRSNVVHGETAVHAPHGGRLGAFLLHDPGDLAVVDDRRVLHGVAPIVRLDPRCPGVRDVLVVTFRHREG